MTDDIQSIQAQIDEADAKKAELEAELEAQRVALRREFVLDTRAGCEKLGMPIEDLIRELGGRKPAKTRKPRQARVLKSDPSGPIYKGGAVPMWLADAMFGAGYAPSDKARRAAFIAEHMEAA